MRYKIRCVVICYIFISIFYVYPATLIFDLGQVLVKTSSFRVSWQIGMINFIGIYNPFTLEQKLFTFLQAISPDPRALHPINLYHGYIMPSIMQDWLTGLRSSDEILHLIDEKINKKKFTMLYNKSEKRLICAMAHTIFKPEIFIQTMSPIKSGVKLLKKCYNKKTLKGNRAHKIYILSNWDKESFDLLAQKEKFKTLFKYTDGIIISGLVHKMKPDPAIFSYLFEQFKINPDREITIFIDDDLANISAANRLGYEKLFTVHCKNCNLKEVKQALKDLDVI